MTQKLHTLVFIQKNSNIYPPKDLNMSVCNLKLEIIKMHINWKKDKL